MIPEPKVEVKVTVLELTENPEPDSIVGLLVKTYSPVVPCLQNQRYTLKSVTGESKVMVQSLLSSL